MSGDDANTADVFTGTEESTSAPAKMDARSSDLPGTTGGGGLDQLPVDVTRSTILVASMAAAPWLFGLALMPLAPGVGSQLLLLGLVVLGLQLAIARWGADVATGYWAGVAAGVVVGLIAAGLVVVLRAVAGVVA